MGQVIEFEKVRAQLSKPATGEQRDEIKPHKCAEVLFFTGVRYERTNALPSQRLADLAGSSRLV